MTLHLHLADHRYQKQQCLKHGTQKLSGTPKAAINPFVDSQKGYCIICS